MVSQKTKVWFIDPYLHIEQGSFKHVALDPQETASLYEFIGSKIYASERAKSDH